MTKFALCAAFAAACFAAAPLRADEPLQVIPLLGEKPASKSNDSADEPRFSVTLTPRDAKPGDGVTLAITVKLPPNGYTYSTRPGFTGGTRIEIDEHRGLEPLSDQFVADPEPKREFVEAFGQEVEKHFKEVTWKRVFRLRPDADPDRVGISGTLRLQVCDDFRCMPISKDIHANLRTGQTAQVDVVAARPVTFTHEEVPELRKGQPGPATIRAELSPKNAKPGDRVTLAVSITVEKGWHTYSITQSEGPGRMPTTIELTKLKALLPIDIDWKASAVPEEKPLETDEGVDILELHHGTIRWTREMKVVEGAEASGYGVSGRLRYNLCDAGGCLPPKRVSFELGDLQGAESYTAAAEEAKPGTVLPAKFEISDTAAGGLPWFLLLAFLGGMVLNVMPCVLPVLAIKVMSFVQQAGESRSRIFALNLSYSGGVVLVFLILASLAVGLGLGWGGLFQNSKFNLVMACVIFAMGLSLLGVFEIPVPGFVGAAAGGRHREGLLGAFLTGILATLLATPCSGPFLGATLGWSVRQSPAIVYLVWATMGLGMAFPYVMFGMFPHAIKWLPRPGNWMVRMKEFAGFVLMGTVIFFVYFLEQAYVVPLLIMLLGIGLALWMIGNLYDVTSHIRHKIAVRVVSLSLAAVICTFGYSLADTGKDVTRLPWQAFSEERLEASLAKNQTVLIDFTANWCATCKMVEKWALNTPETKRLVEQHGIVTLYADYTHESPEIKRWLDKFDSESVPLTVIFPGNQPNRPILIRDVYSKSRLLKELNVAVGQAPPPEQQPILSQAQARGTGTK